MISTMKLIICISFSENWTIGLGAVALLTQSIIANEYYSKTDSIINNSIIRLPTNSTENPPKSWLESHFTKKTKEGLVIVDLLSKGFVLLLKGINEYYIM